LLEKNPLRHPPIKEGRGKEGGPKKESGKKKKGETEKRAGSSFKPCIEKARTAWSKKKINTL